MTIATSRSRPPQGQWRRPSSSEFLILEGDSRERPLFRGRGGKGFGPITSASLVPLGPGLTSPGRRGDVGRCISWLASFHARFLEVRPRGLWDVGTYWHLETRRDELLKIDDPAIREAAPILDRRLRAATFQTLVHGDAKLANFCFSRTSVAAVDFQYVGGGCGVRDVAYLLSGEADEVRHLDAYFEHLRTALGDRADAVEREWRGLYPIAAADFYRFLAGWSKEHWRNDAHGQRSMRNLLRAL